MKQMSSGVRQPSMNGQRAMTPKIGIVSPSALHRFCTCVESSPFQNTELTA